MEKYLLLKRQFKNKNKGNAFAMTSLLFQVALLTVVKNDLIIAYVHTGPERILP